MNSQQMTSRQRSVQGQKIQAAIKLLEIARLETRGAKALEIADTIDIAMEIINGVNEFLKSRERE